jgi:large subunit ribosomal protein L4
VTHGPRNEKKYLRTVPKKMRAKALFMALSRKYKDGEILFVDSLSMTEPKTALAKKTLSALSKVSGFEKLSKKPSNAALIALSQPSDTIKKSYRNIGNVEVVDVRSLNPVSVLGKTYLIVENPENAIGVISKRVSSKLEART